MKFEDAEKELNKNAQNKGFTQAYDLPFEIGEMVIDARVKLGLTQEQLAKLVKTKQPSIARLENGTTLPSLSFLEKIAYSMGTYLIAPTFAFLENEKKAMVEVSGYQIHPVNSTLQFGGLENGSAVFATMITNTVPIDVSGGNLQHSIFHSKPSTLATSKGKATNITIEDIKHHAFA